VAEQVNEIRKMTLSKIMCLTVSSMATVTVNPMYKAGAFLPRGVLLPNGIYVTQYVNSAVFLQALGRYVEVSVIWS
jgi:hypothetical protein